MQLGVVPFGRCGLLQLMQDPGTVRAAATRTGPIHSSHGGTMAITGLGHTGFWVNGLEKMREFGP
ncbi:hypothetical protein ACWC09_11410 [Streptomyces sp. NPDC001617]